MFLPSGSMSSECIKYQLAFTMRLALTEKTFSYNALCYETSFFHAHTHTHYSSYEPCVFPAFSGDRENKTRKTAISEG